MAKNRISHRKKEDEKESPMKLDPYDRSRAYIPGKRGGLTSK